MTRGTIYILLENKFIQTDEFNGDMYPGGHYEEVIDRLEVVNRSNEPEISFKIQMLGFNANNHKYSDFGFYETAYLDTILTYSHIDFTDYYNDKHSWFSDYIFIINKSGRDFTVILRNEETCILADNSIFTVDFGGKVEEYLEQYIEIN